MCVVNKKCNHGVVLPVSGSAGRDRVQRDEKVYSRGGDSRYSCFILVVLYEGLFVSVPFRAVVYVRLHTCA